MANHWRWKANPPAMHARQILDEFVWPFEYDHDACWPWRGTISTLGYGRFAHTGAHIVVFELLVGDLPETWKDGRRVQLDHLCENRACVNPKHLQPTSSGKNIQWARRIGNGHRSKEDHFESRKRLPWYNLDLLSGLNRPKGE